VYRQKLPADSLARAAKLGLDERELITLASIIEKEVGHEEELPLISSTYHNRLQRKMRLQADPTVIYGIADYDGNLRKRHLEAYSPYNTYRITGLPPGPIASPGLKSIVAALNPAPSEFLYFVADGRGGHDFSRTYREHAIKVRRYLLKAGQ
jgi:UPF0755 protein